MNAKASLVADIPLSTDFATDGRAAIRLTVGRLESVGLEVYDVRVWDGRDGDGNGVASGIYIARLVTEDGVRTRKMRLLK